VKPQTQKVVIWGWLRLFLGLAQTSLAFSGVWALLTIGLHPLMRILIGGAAIATILSRLLYKGRARASDMRD
jgi:hypothetical protein